MLDKSLRKVFRLYDIRGIYGSELTPDVMARIGLAIAHYHGGRYAVGMDVRASSPLLSHALISGLLAGGVDVVDVGEVPIGAMMYASLHKKLSGAYVTASHLPPEWNGVKLFRAGGDPMVGEDIARICELFYSDLKCGRPGRYARVDLLPEYEDFLLSRASATGLRIVVDCGNGAAALVVPRLLREAGHDVYALNADVDPRFPGRGSEPTPDSLRELCEEVIRRGAHFGVAFDGDGDRTVFVDDGGRVLTAEQAAIVMLEGMGYGEVVANVECSMILEELVEARGHRVYRVPVGRTFMVREVSRRGAVLGVESSGHYVVWRNLNMDDGLLTLLYFIEAASKLGRISEVVPPAYPIVKLRVEVPDEIKFEVVKELAEELASRHRVETLDGVKVYLEDGWVLVRPSNTEPVVRITCEARSPGEARRLAGEYADRVKKLAARFKES